MNKKAKKELSYLLVLSNYLLLDNLQQESPKIINELNEKLNDVLRKIQGKILRKEFKKEDCQPIAEQIDELIYLSAELSQIPLKIPKEDVDYFKEKSWYLLETLEEYSIEKFNISIW